MSNLKYILYKMYLLKQNPGLGFESGFYYRRHILFSAVGLFVEIKRLALFVFEFLGVSARVLWKPVSRFSFKYSIGIPVLLGFVLLSPIVSAIQYAAKKEQVVIDKYSQYDIFIKKAAEKYRIDPVLIKAIIMTESSFNARTVSRAGACGLMQLMPNTARLLSVEDIFDPEENIMGGTRFFSLMLDEFNCNLDQALAAYNAGPRYLRKNNGKIPPYKETRAYIKKVHNNYRHFASANKK